MIIINIILKELKSNLRALIFWIIGISVFVFLGMSEYSAAQDIPGGMDAMLKHMPDFLQRFFGIGVFDLTKPIDYYGLLFMYFVLAAASYAVILGGGIISWEERDKTAEFLFSRPVSRIKILTSKLLAAIILLFIFCLLFFGATVAVLNLYSDSGYLKNAFFFTIALLVIQILFLSLGMLLAAVSKNPKKSGLKGMGAVMIFFTLSVFIDMTGMIDFLKILTPFQYFTAADILKGSPQPLYMILTAVLVIFFTIFSFIAYKNKDLKI